jgi:DNA-binding beta-propeller fold protein YncE
MRVVMLLLLLAGPVRAAGLNAVAVSRDGKSVAVGGQNRVVYVLDAVTGEVRHRIGLKARVVGLAFAPDAASLLVEDETNTLQRVEVASGKVTGRMSEVSGLLASPAGDVVLVRDERSIVRPALRLLDFHLDEQARYEQTERASAFTFDAVGKRVYVLESSHDTDTEKRVPFGDAPAALTGLERLRFQQENDGRASFLRTYELGGKEVRPRRLWYTSDSDSTRLHAVGDVIHVVNRGNVCARIDPGGEITLYQTAERINQAVAASPDGKVVVVGGRAGGTWEGAKRVPFALDELPGQAELVTALAVRADGTAWGGTTAFRLFRIGRDGKVEKVIAVF